jgi:hypothetical protein
VILTGDQLVFVTFVARWAANAGYCTSGAAETTIERATHRSAEQGPRRGNTMMTPHPALVAEYLRLVQLDGMQVDQASVVLALENAANRDGAPVGVGLVSGMLYIDRIAGKVWAERRAILQRAEVLDLDGQPTRTTP